ncbi:MAG: MFS transporter [Candidatus Aminicenantes bacterium]|nr:MFS transporter [Candidatus Aminicenantes bacterium]
MSNKHYKEKPIYRFLFILTIASAVGLQGWRTLFNNFAVEQAGVDGLWVGIIQSVREVPGFLALLVIYLLLIFKEHNLSRISVIMLGVGVGLTGFFPSNIGLVFTTLLMSVGFHYFETTNQSLTLQHFNKNDSAIVMGRFKSISSLANIGIGLTIWTLSQFIAMRELFLMIGAVVILLAFRTVFIDPSDNDLPPQKKKMVLKSKYWLFYVLNFLAGARRQIFVVFAVFLLVEHYKFSIQMITALFVINNFVNYLLAPVIAKAINRYGERRVLSLEYGSLIFIFVAYAFVESPILAGGLYILDHIFFNFSIAIKTYFQKTGDTEDIAPSMAVSFTINHITAVFLPFVGGMLWMIDRRIPFIMGAVISVFSLIFVQFIRTGYEKNQE